MLKGQKGNVKVTVTVGKAFKKMQEAAKREANITLTPTSGIRDKAEQEKLFSRVSRIVQQYAGKPYINPKTGKMDQAAFTAAAAAYKKETGKTLFKAGKPGKSKHQEGVGNALDISLFSGGDTSTPAAHLWMEQNAHRFGFKQPNWAKIDDRVHWEYAG